MPRRDGRPADVPRPVEIIPGFHRPSDGSVLYRAGQTVVLCTASVDNSVPEFLRGKGTGWLTAEYQMHPRANPPRREAREGRGKALSGRTQEIQRLVGRALRAAVDLSRLGERTITIDCDVLEADGGTRTASITGSFVALVLALSRMQRAGQLREPVLRDIVSAISVGLLDDGYALDLVYTEDSTARVDLNVVATGRLALVEIQGTAEGEAAPRSDIDAMIDLALAGCRTLVSVQKQAILAAGVDLATLFVPERWTP
jgi:ribonuclease PH